MQSIGLQFSFNEVAQEALFLLVSVLSEAFFTLVGRHLVSFSFFTARHSSEYFKVMKNYFLTELEKVLQGLKAGIL